MKKQLSLATQEKGGLRTGRERSRIVLVTPKMAEAWIEKNTQNRSISRMKVERFKRFLVSGQWQLTHQGIAFDTDGTLVDGQHRLLAIIESGIAAYLMVTENVAVMTRITIDTLGGRRLAHTLQIIGGSKNPTLEAAMIAVIRWGIHGFKGGAQFAEGMALREKHAAGFAWVVEHASNKRLWCAPAAAAFAYAYPACPKFCESIVVNYEAGSFEDARDPLLRLRNYVLTTGSLQSHETRIDMFRKGLTAIYMRLKGQQRDRLAILDAAVQFFIKHHGD